MTTQSATDRRGRSGWIIFTSGTLSSGVTVVGASIVLLALSLSDARAQLAIRRLARPAVQIDTNTNTDDEEDGQFTDGPSLSTDTDVDRLLRRANVYIGDRRFDLATMALQQALDDQYQVARREGQRQGEDERTVALMKLPDDQWKPVATKFHPKTGTQPIQPYRSVAHEVERMIRKLPPAGLRIYQLTADGKAQGLLEKAKSSGHGNRHGNGAEEALAELVWKYFNSAYGDEAAFQLGCLLMERRDFVGANRYFEKILSDHPSPTVSRQQVLLRLAVVNARLGDREAATKRLNQLHAAGLGTVSPLALNLVSQDVLMQGGSVETALAASKAWRMRFGTPARDGVMPGPGLPRAGSDLPLHHTWRHGGRFVPAPSKASAVAVTQILQPQAIRGIRVLGGGIIVSSSGVVTGRQADVNVAQLITAWRAAKWTPSSRMLMADGRVFVKTYHYPWGGYENKRPRVQLICYDALTGERKWWKPWSYDDQQPSSSAAARYVSGVSGNKPDTVQEVSLFGDHISHAMSLIDGVLYTLEGDPGLRTTTDQFRRPRSTSYGVLSNRLVAWQPRGMSDADGKVIAHEGGIRWQRGGDLDPETGDERPVLFCAAPLPFGERLIVPVRDAGSLWLYSLGPKKNEEGDWEAPTVWKTLLCDEPPGGVNPFATVGVAVRGSDIYVGSGAGVVFAVDGATGVIRWATRYKRKGVPKGVRMAGFNRVPTIARGMNISGFDVDTVIPYGRALVVLPSDANDLIAFDRRTGEPLYDSPRDEDELTYCLGTAGRWLILGGPNMIAGFDLRAQGIRKWNAPLAANEALLGRGCVTTEGIFLPINDKIVCIDLNSGLRVSEMHVGEVGNAPLGNLYSNGERLFALGIDGILALGSIERLVAKLNPQVDKPVDPQGDVEAQQAARRAARIERMWLQAKQGATDAAIADLRVLVAEETKRSGEAAGLALLAGQIVELDLATKATLDSFDLILTAKGDWAGASDVGRQQRLAILATALRAIGNEKQTDAKYHTRAIALVLKLISQNPQQHLLVTAQQTLSAAAKPADVGVLTEALKSDSAKLRVGVIGVLISLQGAKAADALAGVLDDKDSKVRLEAARGLADVGDPRALSAFVDLLTGDDVIVRGQAVASLRAVSDQQFDFAPDGPPQARMEAIVKWRDWVEKEGEKAKLDRSRRGATADLGRLLIVIQSRGELFEYSEDGTQTFYAYDIRAASACQGLPNGHRLVASREGRKIIEFDEAGRRVLNASVTGSPISVQRLKNEHILVACESKVVEVDPAGREILVRTPKANFLDARRVAGGRTLLAMLVDGQGLVVEVDRQGNIVREIAKAQKPVAVRRLANGNTLVVDEEAPDDGPQVIEYDAQGKIVWSKSGLASPHDVQRLPNGNTLVVDNTGIQEFDAAGKLVWKRDQKMVRGAYRY